LGVQLRDLFPQHPIPIGWHAGKRVAVDGHNVAFRYLTSIRSRTGDVLRNAEGRVTSHLYGFLGLVRHLRERGAEPVVIWDGDIHPRKWATVEGRIQRRLEAALNAEEALASGDHEAHHKYLRATTYLDGTMIQDCSRLLATLGVAVVRAPHDGERYAAALCHAGHADVVATEDFDALVAGAPAVLRKAGSADSFLHQLSDLGGHGLTPEQLRHVAILCGTDWHPGVKGFGAKTALKALAKYPDLRQLIREAETGAGSTRWHQMVAASGLGIAAFEELDAYIRELPPAPAPVVPRPDPSQAVTFAEGIGVVRDKVLACFC
jgi:flap endonuclease-1